MEDPVSSTIEKIKLQEQDKEAKLKEKRELEATIATLNKAIREAAAHAEKSEQGRENLTQSTDSLRRQKMLEECRRDALSAQLNSLKNELKVLQAKSSTEISKVWQMRSLFCKEVHNAADACDVWTLLMKPGCAEPVSRNVQMKAEMPTGSENENRLQAAIERRVKSLTERDRLATEPDNGEEFLR
ncbi:jg16152 [Pararge aegeria aegeria]|uniref:Jg16152 protein n=2 Tax=Pararge aegeria TaxID=116150 RepID=A0A8S4REC1_9NEOP|nr:jg16152 [Pararge aegeria aegeria]